ncbi:F0F1 ATP synthase subunit B' [Nitratifractor sp.]|uniref:F0F1 ATP synthase subunit B family protein n=1 Tax=Nitratifractor sp. TaxID=2268144 RepID=UPI0025CDD3B3|nr:F0F1 ATP synthase subunit B' [Nitratifractor sp.]
MLELHPFLMGIVLLIFFFLIYQLNDRLYKPLLRFMDDRDQTIARDLEAAKNLSSGSEELLTQAQAKLESARSEAARIRQAAIEAVKAENETALTAKQQSLEEEYRRFTERLSEERKNLRSAVLSQLPLIKESLKAKFSQI